MSYTPNATTGSSPANQQMNVEAGRGAFQQFQSQPQLGDVYEFQSSPEEENGTSVQNAPGNYFPTPIVVASSASASPSMSMGLQQKSSSASSIPAIVANATALPPPPKRIKTAVLAKKLLAAAVDSNILDPSSLPLASASQQPGQQRKTGANTNQPLPAGTGAGQEVEDGEQRAVDEPQEQEEEEKPAIDDEAEAEEAEELARQPHRAHSFSGTPAGQVQEQKKVPPLRISLLKTPSEEGEGPSTASPTSTTSSAARKSRGGGRTGSTGRRVGGHGSRKEDNLQRVTRSRMRQIATGDGTEQDGQPSRKRRSRGGLGAVPEMAAAGGVGAVQTLNTGPFEEEQPVEEEEENIGTMPTLMPCKDEAGAGAEHMANVTTANQSGKDKDKPAEPSAPPKPQEPSLASTLLAKSSLEQSVAFEAMMHDKWAKQYRQHLAHVLRRVEEEERSGTFLNDPKPEANCLNCSESEERLPSGEWPEELVQVFNEQRRRRRELAEEHLVDRERLRGMARRELARTAQKWTNNGTEGEGESDRLFPIVSYLRDVECYDPSGLLADSTASSSLPGMAGGTAQRGQSKRRLVQQRFTHLANTTRHRHTMEAHALLEVQKAEWLRTARRAQREAEHQQLMLKGPIGSGTGGMLPALSFPTDLWLDLAVPRVPVPSDGEMNVFGTN